MTSRRRIFIGLLLLAVVGFVVITRPREPSSDGKRLSEWLRILDMDPTREEEIRAEEAVRSIGSNAIPALLRMAKGKDSYLKRKIVALNRTQDLMDVEIETAEWSRVEAIRGYSVLGAAAVSAVPDLVELLHDDETCDTAAGSLVGIGPEGVKHVAEMLTNADVGRRFIAVVTLARIGLDYRNTNLTVTGRAALDRKADVAVTPLVACLNDSTYPYRAKVVTALKLIGRRPELVVPAFVQVLNESEPPADVIRVALFGIAQYGSAAQSASSTVERFLVSPDERVRKAATNALSKIY